ncbi:RNA polymerase sigma-70 factor, ECF subfamily [Sphingomonas gellani]|uniref:RNA polymerase sigma-70 factor, ECF subfamily n=1 Tax=Sphingomonas gellani TaxID=1166340 RepID=A0A1H8DV61_9SPHN|nr:RNA polymerase sigma factor [Sphingomonas gellani]SEN11093.1 RNA polymerase sigma-70 factor, ECF subfamily [Sphingomonas gellani]
MPPPGSPTGIEAVFLANRDKLLRFLAARGAGDAAEDLVQDLWIKVSGRMDGPIGNPVAYLFRAADMLMIDRYRARRQAERRDHDWSEGQGDTEPPAERVIAARQEAARVTETLATLGTRVETIFRRARMDGVTQRQIAAELGISVSTVESDLRLAARALADLKERMR